MFSGTVRIRDRLHFGRDAEAKVTAISVFDRGSAVAAHVGRPRARSESCGVWARSRSAMPSARSQVAVAHHFAPPTLETVVVPRDPNDKGALRVALAQLAEQDPLIDVRQDDIRQELSVSLYGEVQKEVIQATLASDFGLDVTFRETTTICIERPTGSGEAPLETLRAAESNPFLATIGLRIESCAYRLGRRIPTPGRRSHGPAVRLQDGRSLHRSTCVSTSTDAAGGAPRLASHRLRRDDHRLHVQRPRRPSITTSPLSTAADFRKLTPIVVMRALEVLREPSSASQRSESASRSRRSRSAPSCRYWGGSVLRSRRRRYGESSRRSRSSCPRRGPMTCSGGCRD